MSKKSNSRLRRNAPLARPRATISPTGASWGLGSRAATLNTLAAAVAGILYCAGGTAYAQTPAAAAAPTSDVSSLDEIVVTASANGVKKLDASYSIVSISSEMIKDANPKSTADLLKLSPGIWPESSGGQTGANIEIAGFPGGGDAPFFTNMVQGSPLYGMPSLSFMDSSSLLRLDDTVDRVEIVQGGPGAIFGPGQMGATANFILKRGTAEPTGSIGLTYGSEGMKRVDAFYGFPLAQGWYASVGGFYRKSDGVRDPQFPSDDGGQFTATLSHDLDNGSFMLWGRALNDKNQFMTPVPLIENANGSFSNYPGFSATTSTFASKPMQNVSVPSAGGGFEQADLANGRGANMNFIGGNYDADFNGWKISDKFIWDGGDLNTNALFSGPNPRPLSYFLYGCGVAQPAGFCDPTGKALDSNNLGPNGQGLPLSTNVNARYVNGQPVAANQSVIEQGWWYIQKHLVNINNDFRLSKEVFDGNTATAGLYITHYTDHDNWSLGNQMLMSNTPNATPIVLNYTQGGQTFNLTSPQGIVNMNGNFDILEDGTGQNIAPYLSDSWKVGPFLFDASARYEHISVRQETCNRTNQPLGTANDLYDNNVGVCNGTFDVEHYSKNATSWTVGANYEIFNNMSVYVRANNGTHFDDFDNGIRGVSPNGNFSPVQTIKNYEGGFKYQSHIAYVDLSVYHKQFTGLTYQETDAVGVPFGPISTYGSDAKGVNFIGTVTPIANLNLTVLADYMDGHYTHYNGCAPYTDLNGNHQCSAIDGAPIQRQPKVHVMVTPSYTLVPFWGSVTAFVTYEHVGQRFEDQSGLQPLGTYYSLGAGIVADYGKNWEFRLSGTNLTDQIGLTEGNARKFGVETGIGGVILARSIEGREVNIEAKYKF
jgi:outer membrane receptor protein involved in Fe transport